MFSQSPPAFDAFKALMSTPMSNFFYALQASHANESKSFPPGKSTLTIIIPLQHRGVHEAASDHKLSRTHAYPWPVSVQKWTHNV